MPILMSLIILLLGISLLYLKEGKIHSKLYLFELNTNFGDYINYSDISILPYYNNILKFINRFQGGGVLYNPTNDANYGKNLAIKLQKDNHKVLYLKVPENIENFHVWFNLQFKNMLWWSDRKSQNLLKESNLIIILDNYDNIFLNNNINDVKGHTNTLTIVEAHNLLLYKIIFIIRNKEYAIITLEFNGGAKYYNLYTKNLYTKNLID